MEIVIFKLPIFVDLYLNCWIFFVDQRFVTIYQKYLRFVIIFESFGGSAPETTPTSFYELARPILEIFAVFLYSFQSRRSTDV